MRRSRCAWIWRASGDGPVAVEGNVHFVAPIGHFRLETPPVKRQLACSDQPIPGRGPFAGIRGGPPLVAPPSKERLVAGYTGAVITLGATLADPAGRATAEDGMSAGEAPIKQAVKWIDDQLQRQSRGRSGEARGRGVAALRSLAARRGLPLPPPRGADRREVSEAAGTRRVQAQFGASAAAYVTSAAHAAGEDLDRLLAWGAARRPDRVLDVATGAATPRSPSRASRAGSSPMTSPSRCCTSRASRSSGRGQREFVAGDVARPPVRGRVLRRRDLPPGRASLRRRRARRAPDPSRAAPGRLAPLQDILGHDDAALSAFILESSGAAIRHTSGRTGRAEWKAFLRARRA